MLNSTEKCPGGCGEGECRRTLQHTYACDCPWYKGGDRCQDDVNPCDDDPCDGKKGWWGKSTETECRPTNEMGYDGKPKYPGFECVDPCKEDLNICNSQGTENMCVNTPKDDAGYVCLCDCPFNGDNCESM